MIGPINDGGDRLTEFLDGSYVESRWIAGDRIVWQTGQSNGAQLPDPDRNTHCSAYVAAMAMYLDIYVLRPPNAHLLHLANAQNLWLAGGRENGGPTSAASHWSSLGSSGDGGVLDSAVSAANVGKLVLASYFEPAVTRSDGTVVQGAGHIVIVRPQTAYDSADGPKVATAGVENLKSSLMRIAFQQHQDAWPNDIQLFACPSPLE